MIFWKSFLKKLHHLRQINISLRLLHKPMPHHNPQKMFSSAMGCGMWEVYRWQEESNWLYLQMLPDASSLLPLQEKQGHRPPCCVLYLLVSNLLWKCTYGHFNMACFLFQTCMYWGIWFMLTEFSEEHWQMAVDSPRSSHIAQAEDYASA